MKLTSILILLAILTSCTHFPMKKAEPGFRSAPTSSQIHAEPAAIKTQEAQIQTASPHKRVLTYQAEIKLLVDDISSVSHSILQDSQKMGGFMTSMNNNFLELRIPVKHLESYLEQIEKYGKVLNKAVKATDVTDKMFDLKTRLANAEKLRSRLLTLLEKTTKIDETLKVEKELARITGELEYLKGTLKKMNENISYSKLKIFLNSPTPIKELQVRLPFSWIRSLAHNLRTPHMPSPRVGGWLDKSISAAYPKSFAAFYEYGNINWAMDGRGCFIKIQRVKNKVEASDEFWKNTISKYLEQSKLLRIIHHKDFETKSGSGFIFTCSQGSSKKRVNYQLLIVNGKDYSLICELWGPEERLKERNMEVKSFFSSVKTSLSSWF